MIKETVHKEEIKIPNMYTNNRIPIHMKQKLMGRKDKSIIIIGGFHTLFSEDIGNFNKQPTAPNRHLLNTPPQDRQRILFKGS